jgi:hypothetical protein
MRVLDNGRLSGGRRENGRGLIDGIFISLFTRFIDAYKRGHLLRRHMAEAKSVSFTSLLYFFFDCSPWFPAKILTLCE